MQFLLQEKSVQNEAAEGSAENHDDDDKDGDQDVKPAAEDADKIDDNGDEDDDEGEEFDSSDEQILTKSGESRKYFYFEVYQET